MDILTIRMMAQSGQTVYIKSPNTKQTMSDFFTRMQAEQRQLGENIAKLEAFLDGDISGNSKDYIAYSRMQLHAMRAYLYAVSARISIVENSTSAG